MATSLAEQLSRLATPQTSLYKHTKKKASVLFSPSDAASYDRQHIYDLGLSGFVELKSLNGKFAEFEDTLFDQSSISFERSVCTKEENAVINKRIKKFLHLLSPYFALKASLKALEWLIRRYHIHSFNIDDLVMLALPYHGTNTFVRVIQVLDLSVETGRWHWLKPLQKPGIPLSKTVLINHCASSPAFLKLLCDTTIDAIKAHGHGNASALSTLIAFYCTTVIGALEQNGTKVTELQITHLLEALILGYASKSVDFVAASYMITAQLVTKASLSSAVLERLLTRIVKKLRHPELLPDSIFLLIVLYQNQHTITDMPIKAVVHLGNSTNFPETLGEISKGHRVTPLLLPMIKQALNIIQSQDESSAVMKTLVEQLLTQVKLDQEDADAIVRAVIDGYHSPDEEMSDVVIDKDDIMKWYSSLIQSLERAYPTVFDAAVCRTLKGEGISPQRAQDLKVLLGFELPLDLLDKLHHPEAKVRASSARSLSRKISSFTEKDLQALQGSLENFLLDNDVDVVGSALSFPPGVLRDVMGKENLRKALIRLLKRCVIATNLNQWKSVIGLAVKYLCDLEIEDGPQEIDTLLALLPLFDQANVVKSVVFSKFNEKSLLIKRIRKVLKSLDNLDKAVPALVQCLSHETNLVKAEDVLEVAKTVKEQCVDDEHWYVDRFYTSLLLAASVPNGADPSLGLKLLEENDNLLGSKQLVCSSKEVELNSKSLSAGLKTCRGRALPIMCGFHLLSVVISRVKSQQQNVQPCDWFDLEDDSDQTKLLIEVYRKILTGCVHSNKDVSSAYVGQMQLFFKEHCPTIEDQLAFLLSVSTFHEVSLKLEHLELSLRSLRLAKTFLSACDKLVLRTDGDSNIVPAILLALQCSSPTIRHEACDVARVLIEKAEKPSQFKALLRKILSMQEEILIDEKQLGHVLQNILSPISDFHSGKLQAYALKNLLLCAHSETTPTYVVAGLLRALSAVNSEEILESLAPLVRRSLEIGSKSEEPNKFCSEIVRNVLGRLDSSTCGCLVKLEPWNAVVAAFHDQKTPILSPSGKVIRPPVVICEQIEGSLWEALANLPGLLQENLLTLLLASRSVAECPEVISAVSSAFKRITLDSATAIPTLVRMKEVQVQVPETSQRTSLARRSLPKAPSPQILQTDEWREGLALLELLQVKKKLNNVHLLIPILFDLLKRCLDFEEQAPVEYAKQVLLSCILLCCSKMNAEENQQAKTSTIKSVINVELVVQCIRASQNPQTHHHALLVLTHLADIVPDQVLHNIMAIFTFMGSLVLRQDDAYSFQVTSKILETIIPVLVKSSDASNQGKLEETVASVVRVFVDALLDVPEHRRLGLYRKLLSTLDASRFLWVFLCLVFESHVVQSRTESSEPKRKGANSFQSEVPKRLEVALQLVHEFPVETIFVNCVSLLQYVRMLPMEVDEKTGKRPPISGELEKYNIATLFNVEQNTPKALRHYKYTIVTFLSALLSSKPLVEKMASVEEKSLQSIEPVYHSFLASLLSFIQGLNQQVNTSKSPQSAKYWGVMLGQTCEILDKVNALLPSSMFITVISGLLVHNIQLLRRKALELLNARLSPVHSKQFMLTCDSESLLKLLGPLMDIVATIEVTQNGHVDEEMEESEKVVLKNNVKDEVILTQQTALYSLKMLTRQLAYDHRDKFIPILERVTNLLKKRTHLHSGILATLILCCAELCSALKAHAIVALPSLVPPMIELLSEYSSNLNESPNLVLLTVVSAVLRVVDTLPNFLSQYLKDLLEKMCTLLALCLKRVSEEGEGCKLVPVVTKLTLAGQKMSTSITPRVLVPAVSQCYKVLKSEAQIGVGPLMTILLDSFAGLNPVDLRNLLGDLTDFFLSALNYRDECASKSADDDFMAQVEFVEGHVIKAWVSLVLKLSETSFKPLYYKLYDWATRLDSHKDRVITFYRLSYSVSDCLKGLFPSYSGYFLKNAAMLLDHCNVTKVGEPDETEFNDQEEDRPANLYFGSGPSAEKKCASLVEHILNTFKNVFLYDSQDFVNKETFEGLVRPIIDQLENTVGGMDSLKNRAEKILIPCIAQFAVALDDDIVWKHINYQILLKTKHKNPQIRLISLEAVCKVVHKLGDSFLPLIPETMPFLAELLEDEDEHVEKACRHAVQDLEQVLGEPLQKYF